MPQEILMLRKELEKKIKSKELERDWGFLRQTLPCSSSDEGGKDCGWLVVIALWDFHVPRKPLPTTASQFYCKGKTAASSRSA